MTLVESILYANDAKLGDDCSRVGMRYPGLAFGVVVPGIVLPVSLVVVIYIHIVIVIVRKLHFMAESSNSDETALTQSQCKMMGTVSAILAAWIICRGPFMSIALIRTIFKLLGIELDLKQYYMMVFILKVLTYLNSLLNPILYFITSHDFRKAGYKLCKCRPM